MFNYIKADFYRILSKKGLYRNLLILFTLVVIGFLLGKEEVSIQYLPNILTLVFTFCQLVVSVYLLITVYSDEFNSKTFPAAVGFGKSRSGIVLAKLLTNLVFTTVTLAALGVMIYGIITMFGIILTTDHIKMMTTMLAYQTLTGIGFSSVAIVIGFWLQKASAALSVFIMLSLGFFGSAIQFILYKLNLKQWNDYLLENIVLKLVQDTTFETVIPYVIFLALFTIISVSIFRQKDLDF